MDTIEFWRVSFTGGLWWSKVNTNLNTNPCLILSGGGSGEGGSAISVLQISSWIYFIIAGFDLKKGLLFL